MCHTWVNIWLKVLALPKHLKNWFQPLSKKWLPGQIRYSQLTLNNGGILDDLMVTRWDNDSWGLVVNGACKHADMDHLKGNVARLNSNDLLGCACIDRSSRAQSERAMAYTDDAGGGGTCFYACVQTSWNSHLSRCLAVVTQVKMDTKFRSQTTDARELAEALTALEESTWVGLGS